MFVLLEKKDEGVPGLSILLEVWRSHLITVRVRYAQT